MRPWRSWIARQTPTFLAVPVEMQRKVLWSLGLRLGSEKKSPPLTTI